MANKATGRRSDFEYLEGQADKQITKVKITGDKVHIEWKYEIPNEIGEKQIEKGVKDSPEPERVEFSEAMAGLGEHIRKWLIPGATPKVTDEWRDSVYVMEVDYAHTETKGVTASITFLKRRDINGGKRTVSSKIVMPALPLHDATIEGHATGEVETYDEHTTKILNEIMTHAKMYLGGARGPERKRPGEGALFDGLDDKDGDDDGDDDAA